MAAKYYTIPQFIPSHNLSDILHLNLTKLQAKRIKRKERPHEIVVNKKCYVYDRDTRVKERVCFFLRNYFPVDRNTKKPLPYSVMEPTKGVYSVNMADNSYRVLIKSGRLEIKVAHYPSIIITVGRRKKVEC